MSILISLLMIFILVPTIFGGCGNGVSVEGGDKMISEKTIPPIDRSVPEVVETATFAMG